ncbi:SAM-dependent methyltransferase [Patescibacteria group bacterium]
MDYEAISRHYLEGFGRYLYLYWNEPGFIGTAKPADHLPIVKLIKEGDRVLDVGCGWGGPLLFLAKQKPEAHFIGIDLLAEHISKAVAARNSESNVYFICRDFLQMGNWENRFDLILCTDTLCHIDPKYHFINKIFRFLKPGGKIVLFDWVLRGDCEEYPLAFVQPNPALRFSNFMDYHSIVTDNGFQQIEVIDDTGRVLHYLQQWYARIHGHSAEARCASTHFALAFYAILEGQQRHLQISAIKP